jgi:high-affinity Fe2+/Pb2+ permease
MYEILPVMAGLVVGLVIPRLAVRWRAWALIILSVGCGAAASWISGELAVSSGYLAIDTAEVSIAALLMWALTARWHRRRASRQDRLKSMSRKSAPQSLGLT